LASVKLETRPSPPGTARAFQVDDGDRALDMVRLPLKPMGWWVKGITLVKGVIPN
jgi:hypothetical protein